MILFFFQPHGLVAQSNDSYDLDLDVFSYQETEIISLKLSKAFNTKVFLLEKPYRLIVDFNNFDFDKERVKIRKLKSNLINNIRYSDSSKDFFRIVLEFKRPFLIFKKEFHNIVKQDLPNRINLFVSESTYEIFNLSKKKLNKNKGYMEFESLRKREITKLLNKQEKSNFEINFKPKAKPNEIKKFLPSKNYVVKKNVHLVNQKKSFTVFLDPGHGGKDPGAISLNGSYEKKITLNASLILKKSLSKFKNIKVIMSRENDRYLYLRERINLAKKAKSDIFISLHADASKNKNAKGISVFSLSDQASDYEAKKLAQRENKSDFLGDFSLQNSDPLIVGNLIKMFQRETMNQSAELAKYILSSLDEFSLYSRGHRFAGFTVLKSPDIPSILIELGFLTNIHDEKKLKDNKYLKKLCDSLSISINQYLKKNITSD